MQCYSIAVMEDRSTPLFRLLGDIKGKLDELVNATSEYQRAEAAQREVDAKSESERVVRLPIEITSHYEAEERERGERNRRDRIKLYLDIAGAGTAIVLVIVTGITLWVFAKQLTQMRKATKAASDAAAAAQQANSDAANRFREDERPYIWFTVNGTSSPVFITNQGSNPPTGQVLWEWHYTDYGKTPAYGIQWVHEEIKVGNRRSEIKLDRPYRIGSGTPLPPGKDDFAAVPSNPISPDEWTKLLSVDRSIQVRARVDYVDSSGVLYETGFCMSRLASGATEYCDQSSENYIKEFLKPD